MGLRTRTAGFSGPAVVKVNARVNRRKKIAGKSRSLQKWEDIAVDTIAMWQSRTGYACQSVAGSLTSMCALGSEGSLVFRDEKGGAIEPFLCFGTNMRRVTIRMRPKHNLAAGTLHACGVAVILIALCWPRR